MRAVRCWLVARLVPVYAGEWAFVDLRGGEVASKYTEWPNLKRPLPRSPIVVTS